MAQTFRGNEFNNLISTELAVDSGNEIALTSTNQVTVLGLEGDDTVFVQEGELVADSVIKGGKDDDSIVFEDGVLNSTVQGGAGNDSIFAATVAGTSVNTLFQTLSGENYFEIWDSSQSTIEAGSGKDTIVLENDAEDTFVRGRKGDDVITVEDGFSGGILRSGDGSDTVNLNDAFDNSEFQSKFGDNQVNVVDSDGSSFTFGDGSDTLTVTGNFNEALVRGRKGADWFDLSLAVVTDSEIRAGDGRDRVIFEDISGSVVKSTIGRNIFQIADGSNGGLATDNDFIGNNTQSFKPTKIEVGPGGDVADSFFTENRFTDIDTFLVDGSAGINFGQTAQAAGFTKFESTADGAVISAADYTQSVTMTAGALAVGASEFEGGANNDTLIGGREDDTLNGGAGADVHTGNAGADAFISGGTEESTGGTFAANATGVFQTGETIEQEMDVITDFNGSQGDTAAAAAGDPPNTLDDLLGIDSIIFGTTEIADGLFFVRGDYNGVNLFTTSASGADAALVDVAGGNGPDEANVTDAFSIVFEGLGSTLA